MTLSKSIILLPLHGDEHHHCCQAQQQVEAYRKQTSGKYAPDAAGVTPTAALLSTLLGPHGPCL